jgi:hypothetical protein
MKTHPNTFLPLRHGQHKETRLAINLLVFRRKRKFKTLEERHNYDLHLKNSVNNLNQRRGLCGQSGCLRELPGDAPAVTAGYKSHVSERRQLE